jgi:MFS family permease
MASDKKPPSIFYGWWVVAACFLIAVYTSGVVSSGFTAFFQPIATEFNWSYTTVSLASSLRHMEIGLFSPLVGVLLSRFSVRKVLFIGGIITGGSVIFLATTQSLLAFFATFAVISIGMSAVSTVTMMTAVSRWFHRRLGIAMGIATCGFGFSGVMVPVVTALVDSQGWRTAMTILGAGMFFVVLPLALIVRNRPEDYGLIPDGDAAGISDEKRQFNSLELDNIDVSTKSALTSRAFWIITIALAVQHLATNAVSTHVMPYLSSVGVPRTVGSLVATTLLIASMGGRFGFGWLGDMVRKKPLTAWGFAMMAVGLTSFGYADNLVGTMALLLIMFLVLYGVGYGGTTTMRSILPKAYFGKKNYATILGFITGIDAIGGVLGAPMAGYVYDRWGDYHYVWVVLAALSALCVVITMLAPPIKARENTISFNIKNLFSRLKGKPNDNPSLL